MEYICSNCRKGRLEYQDTIDIDNADESYITEKEIYTCPKCLKTLVRVAKYKKFSLRIAGQKFRRGNYK